MRAWRLFAGVLCLALSPQAANAAGAAPVSWSGFYAGINAGWATADSSWNNLASTAFFVDTLLPASFSDRISGALGGVQIGYNVQSGPVVAGIEVLANIASISGETPSQFGAADDIFKLKIEALLTATGRVGYAWDNSLVYIKAGVAAAFMKASVADNVGPTTGSGRDDSWRIGPTVGIGFEYAVTSAVSVAVEYNYAHLSDTDYELGDATGTYLWNIDVPDVHWIGARLNYRFN